MIVEPDLEIFEAHYKDAKAYHFRAEQFLRNGQRYSLVFNVAAVALERYLLAFCELHGVIPMNHNYINLVSTLERTVRLPEKLSKQIRSLDAIFGICSIDNYNHPDPEPADAGRVLTMCSEVAGLIVQHQSKADLIRNFSAN